MEKKTESTSYDPASVEAACFDLWQQGGYFAADIDSQSDPFCVVIPPPNVTGALHLGHALNNTLQDILIRQKRMEQRNTFWLVGTDHAGIATQATVEKTIRKEEGKSRHDLGREEMVRRIWAWKEKFGGRIVEQLKLMGCSCDYDRERFTLDEMCAKAVRHTFFKLFRDGLIYRGKKLVNWDTELQTAVANDEKYHETVKGHFYHFKYPVKDPKPGEPEFVHIATTRPETMLADTAVAVHPDPERELDKVEKDLKAKLAAAVEKEVAGIESALADLAERRTTLLPKLIQLRDMANDGRTVMLPLVNREIPIICDRWAKPELGSGCVKITPAHDENDYKVGIRHDLPQINILTEDGKIAEIVEPDETVNGRSKEYEGLKFSTAGRKKVVEDLEALDLVEKIEDRKIEISHSDRSKAPIEPFLSDQWFVRMGDLEPDHASRVTGLRASGLAQMAIEAVTSGAVRFHPARYEKQYLDWLNEKRDWCISRQLWWGHRIPVWMRRGPAVESNIAALADREDVAATIESDAEETRAYFCLLSDDAEVIAALEGAGFTQEQDVLDTWFSSALWPHSTLGWPDANAGSEDSLLGKYYPTQVLSTAREIITLWVARMVITGLYNIGEVPFTDVVIHSVIQDGNGQKMSKSLGNGVDPVDIILKYGADAMRFTLASLATETQDIRMPVQKGKLDDGREVNTSPKFEQGRNFCNKLWQASTGFVLRNVSGFTPAPLDPSSLRLEDRWILSRLSKCTEDVNAALEKYRFSEAINGLYHFMWDDYCNGYLEMTKTRFDGADGNAAKQVLVYVLDRLLCMLHPFIPFVTEAIWKQLNAAVPSRGVSSLESGAPALIKAAWPQPDGALRDASVESEMDTLWGIIRALRELRTLVNDQRGKEKQPSCRTLPRAVICTDAATSSLVDQYLDFVTAIGYCDAIELDTSGARPKAALHRALGVTDVFVPAGELIDLGQVKAAEEKKLVELRQALERTEKKLSSEGFVKRANPEVVEETRQRAADLSSRIQTIETHLADLSV